MKNNRTLWRNRESKWKPRNLQAALICIKAKDIHLPPPEPVVYTPNALDVRKAEIEAARKRVAEIEAGRAQQELDRKEAEKKNRDFQKKLRKDRASQNPSCNWVTRNLRQQAKLRNAPKPTSAELDAAKTAYKKGYLKP